MKFPLSRKQFFASNLVNWKDKKRNHDKRNRARAMVFRKNCKRHQTNMTKTSQFLLPQRAAASLWFSIFLMNGVPTRGGLLLCTIPARVTEAEFIVLISVPWSAPATSRRAHHERLAQSMSPCSTAHRTSIWLSTLVQAFFVPRPLDAFDQ